MPDTGSLPASVTTNENPDLHAQNTVNRKRTRLRKYSAQVRSIKVVMEEVQKVTLHQQQEINELKEELRTWRVLAYDLKQDIDNILDGIYGFRRSLDRLTTH